MTVTQVQQDNVALTRRGFEAFAAGDLNTLGELFHPDATWHSAPLGVLGGNYAGRDQIFAMFAKIGPETGGTFRVVPRTFTASGDEVFVHALVAGTRAGRTLDSDEVLRFVIVDGKVREITLYLCEYPENVEFWS